MACIELRRGDGVVVVNLRATEYNGLEAVILDGLDADGRHPVAINKDSTLEKRRIKPMNLGLVSRERHSTRKHIDYEDTVRKQKAKDRAWAEAHPSPAWWDENLSPEFATSMVIDPEYTDLWKDYYRGRNPEEPVLANCTLLSWTAHTCDIPGRVWFSTHSRNI